jgi:hypothetical protein
MDLEKKSNSKEVELMQRLGRPEMIGEDVGDWRAFR